jgi:hypothetical protein
MSNYSRKADDKYIGFDIDSTKVTSCVVQAGFSERYRTISSDIASMRRFLEKEKLDGSQVQVVFEISGQAGYTDLVWLHRPWRGRPWLSKPGNVLQASSCVRFAGFV